MDEEWSTMFSIAGMDLEERIPAQFIYKFPVPDTYQVSCQASSPHVVFVRGIVLEFRPAAWRTRTEWLPRW